MQPTRPILFVAALAALAGCKVKTVDDTGENNCAALPSQANLCDSPYLERSLTLLQAMSLEEKVQQMSGPEFNPNNMFDQQSNDRVDVPGFLYLDGPRGARWYNTDYGSTVFPVSMARAAAWDPELERLIGKGMAKETRYFGRHILLAPTINQVTHPRWGRAQESYGEDAYLLGVMGAAFIDGAQYDPTQPDALDPNHEIEDTYRIQACAKHFAANNIEDTRIYVNAVVDDRTLHEVFLPQFQDAVDHDVACFMAAYNRVNGDYNGYSDQLLRGILKEDWGYKGWVVSDWFAKGQTNTSPQAGLDVEMPFSSGAFPSQFDSQYFYGSQLSEAVNAGQVAQTYVDEAALRILHAKVAFGLLDHDVKFEPFKTKSDELQELALQAAREGMVLLHNGPTDALSDDVLPLEASSITKVAVIGRYANERNMGDKGSSDAKVLDPELEITPFEGLKTALPSATAVYFETVEGNEAAIADADLVVVVGAYVPADLNRSASGEEGEWKDRESLKFPQRDLDNIDDAITLKQANAGMKLVVVGKSGGSIDVSDWIADVDAFLMAWYGGMQEGTAIAEILLGDVNPSGKTPLSWPMQESDLPAFPNATFADVQYSYYHGYRWYELEDKTPRYPFGFGLSYTTYAYSNLQVSSDAVDSDGTLTVTVDVENTGSVAGTEVVQAYVGFDNTALNDTWGRPHKVLQGFARAEDLAPGAKVTVSIDIDVRRLGYWSVDDQDFIVEQMVHQLYVGPSSDESDANMLTGTFQVN